MAFFQIIKLLILVLPMDGIAPEENLQIIGNTISDENIHTVSLYRQGWPMSYPYLNLQSDQHLVFTFDDLSEDLRDLSYEIILCNADWTPSDLWPEEYLEGFNTNPILDHQYATNTTVPYIHYRVKIPNENLRINLSGNYIIRVRDANDQILINWRFVVFENLVSVDPSVLRGDYPDYPGGGQQLTLDIRSSSFRIEDPARSIRTVIIQNGNWSLQQVLNRPDALNAGGFSYSLSSRIIFPGGNEFRHFEISDIRFKSQGIRKITYMAPNFNVLLEPDQFRRFKPYFHTPDLNGKFLIKNSRGSDPDVDADYVHVFFTLESPFPLDKEVYLFGGISGWEVSNRFRMKYNTEQHQYEKSLLLKQGHYDYLYVTSDSGNRYDPVQLEGSYFDTGNDYTVIIYYRPPGSNRDRVIGLRTFGS